MRKTTRPSAMNKHSLHKQVDSKTIDPLPGEPHMTTGPTADLQMPESVAEAFRRVEALVTHGGNTSLEELQGAVEYLLDKVKAARDLSRAESRAGSP